jgi:hypothetical protein
VTLRPKESRKIPVLKPNILKKTTASENPAVTEERVKEKAKAEGFRYMWFRNIPTTVADFKEKRTRGKDSKKHSKLLD